MPQIQYFKLSRAGPDFPKRHKKGIPLYPNLVNLKSNTMKNTMQRYKVWIQNASNKTYFLSTLRFFAGYRNLYVISTLQYFRFQDLKNQILLKTAPGCVAYEFLLQLIRRIRFDASLLCL